MISTRAMIRHVKGSFAEGTTFLLAWERCESDRELRFLVLLGETRNRIVVLCPDTQAPAELDRHRRRIEDRFIEPYRAALTVSDTHLAYAVPAEIYRRSRAPVDDSKIARSPRGTRMNFAEALSDHQSDHFDASLWQSDKACLQHALDDLKLYARAVRLHSMFKYREARRYLLRVSPDFRRIDDCRLLIADTYRREGRFIQEAAVYGRMEPNKSTNLLHAVSLARCGRFSDAYEALSWAPEGDPNTHYYRALCASAAGDFSVAARHAEETCRLAPTSAEAAYCHLVYLWKDRRYLRLTKALLAFWRASSRPAAEPLDLIDLPEARPAGWIQMPRSSAQSSGVDEIQPPERCPATKELFA
ncbi:hypothetical protein [Bradyrhizobium sp. CB1015]|uniref:hypothetical protein n=1 Tax=Bradyrhizobium sp. CB1015 TaxID=2976822 RepID=UPI0021AA8462|nr:hypothetical protein [Bradyrhizobium sp. CB1015]UWU95731.1 hypothetical protein N2604_18395 [Bradyrhizobium sp. CB1015]